MLKVALTGSIGSGKTTALGIFKKNGAVVASADAWVHEEFVSNAALRSRVARVFGAGVVREGRVDRRALAVVVFKSASSVRRLNALVHPLVKKRLFDFFKKNKRRACAVVEVPLLFEAKFDRYFDVTIGVATGLRQLQRRLNQRGPGALLDVKRRMRYQMADEAKISRCDFVIDNSGSRKKTSGQINKLMEAQLWKS